MLMFTVPESLGHKGRPKRDRDAWIALERGNRRDLLGTQGAWQGCEHEALGKGLWVSNERH